MALLSELVRVIAKVEGLEEVSVGIFARHAREAGFISQGGRGKSAAKMTFTDAANLLIAVNGCALAKEVPEKMQIFRELSVRGDGADNAMKLGRKDAAFGEDLELILRLYSTDAGLDQIRQVWVTFAKPRPYASFQYFLPDGRKSIEIKHHYQNDSSFDDWQGPDRTDETIITSTTLRRVSQAIVN